MSVLNIFAQDAFSVMRLTDALREIKYTPSRIGQLGLFSVQNVDTLDIAIEKDKDQNIMLVQASPRGGPGQTFGRSKRSMRMLKVPHFQVDDAIYADEVQQVRAFAQEMAVERLQEKIAERAAEASQFFALTEEFHRLNIIKTGKLFDADGTSVLYDYFAEFGESQPAEIDFDLDNATPAEGALRKKCATITRSMGQILDGLRFVPRRGRTRSQPRSCPGGGQCRHCPRAPAPRVRPSGPRSGDRIRRRPPGTRRACAGW